MDQNFDFDFIYLTSGVICCHKKLNNLDALGHGRRAQLRRRGNGYHYINISCFSSPDPVC
jgi:hypothetical protein